MVAIKSKRNDDNKVKEYGDNEAKGSDFYKRSIMFKKKKTR